MRDRTLVAEGLHNARDLGGLPTRDGAVTPAGRFFRSESVDRVTGEDFWADFWDNGLVGTPLYYGPHLDRKPDRTVEVLRAMVRAEPGGVLFHCAGGRDRTGIVSLVLLSIAGVSADDIVDDYLVTVETAPALFAAIGVPAQEDQIEALCAEHGTTVADAFQAVVDGFDVDAFVARSGLDAIELEALRTFRARVA